MRAGTVIEHRQHYDCGLSHYIVAPFNQLNAILSLLHPLEHFRTLSAIGSAIGRPLSRPISHPNTGGSPQPPRSQLLGRLNCAIVALWCLKPLSNKRETKMR